MAYQLLRTDVGNTDCWGTGYNCGRYTFVCDVYYEQSISGNYTKLKFVPVMRSVSNYRTQSNGWKVGYNKNKPQFDRMFSHDLTAHSYAEILWHEVTVYHNADGTASHSYWIEMWNSTTGGSGVLRAGNVGTSGNKITFTLPTIPRQSNFVSIPDATMSVSNPIIIDRVVSGFTYTVIAYFGNDHQFIYDRQPLSSTSLSWTPKKDFARQIPNGTFGDGAMLIQTYNGTTLIGEHSIRFMLHVWNGSDCYPSFTSLTLTGVNTWNGYYVKGKSSVNATINGATTPYGATVRSYKILGQGLNATTSSATSSVLNTTGTNTYTATITDSRGRSVSGTASITVQDYYSPQISSVRAYRTNSDGKANPQGNYVRLEWTFNHCNIANANLNARQFSIFVREKGASGWAAITVQTNYSTTAYNAQEATTKGVYDTTKSYEFLIRTHDSFTSAESIISVSTASCLLDIEEKGLGVGKFHEQGILDVSGDIYINGYGMKCDSNGDLKFGDNSVAVTKSVSFTPYLFSNSQISANWTITNSEGAATYLGDLVYAQGRVIAIHYGEPNPNAEVAIGGLPELNIWGHPPVNFCFVGGLTTALDNQTYAIRGFVEPNTSYIRLTFDYRQNATWQYLRSTHMLNGAIDIAFGILYKWR
jgi:hypothetical protein